MGPGRQPEEGRSSGSAGRRSPTLRQARLTAQLELVAADAAGAQIRERALEAAATETARRAPTRSRDRPPAEQSQLEAAQVRADAHGEVARLLEQSRLDAATAALEHRATAEAEARACSPRPS